MESITPTDRTTARSSDRMAYDRATIHAILDEAMLAHVGISTERGPVVLPVLHARRGDELLFHGSPAGRLFRAMKAGSDLCVTATLLDGLVLARSAFHHSVNYRSVVIFGAGATIDDLDERRAALDAITERLVPGRLDYLRPMTEKEVRGTMVVRLPISEASARVRSGPPLDDDEDYDLPIWAGVIPLAIRPGPVEDDPRLPPGVERPIHVTGFGG